MKKEYLNEIWRPIKCYEGLYLASTNGEIYVKDRYIPMPNGGKKFVKGRILQPFLMPNGYCIITLGSTHKDRKRYYVHRIIAETFPEICGEWFNECEIDHINTIRNDNRAFNLKVVSAKENSNNPLTIKHQREAKLGKKMPKGFSEKQRDIHLGKKYSIETRRKISEANKNNPKKSIIVIQFDLQGNFIREWKSMSEAQRNGFHKSSVIKCCRGEYKQHKKYKFNYKSDFLETFKNYLIMRKNKSKIVEPVLNKDGFLEVTLTNAKGESRTFPVHYLVAQQFVPNPHNYPYVRHKDGNKTNNCADNLEWTNIKEV